MNSYANSNKDITNASVEKTTRKMGKNTTDIEHTDNRPEAVAQRKLQDQANNSPQAKHTAQFQAIADVPSQSIQKKENNTGLPDNLKSGIESLSGHAMDDVKVHYNSDKPAGLQAHAYAQGTDIHLGAGQEKHLPHEAWHVAQQKQGRVQPTMQMKGKVNVNDDKGLEAEADTMGAKAASGIFEGTGTLTAASPSGDSVQRQVLSGDRNEIGEFQNNDTIQRHIEYDSKTSTYKTNGDRPGWLKGAEDALLDEYNIRHELSIPKLEYAKEKLDRCHIVAFEDIQAQVAMYLNDPVNGFSHFESFVDAITAHLVDGGDEKTTINTHFKNLIKKAGGSNTDITIKAANSLLSRLNSISENLRAGNKYINSYIGQNLDLLFQQTSSGKYQLTDHSRHVLTNIGGSVSSVLRTPDHQSRLVTSEGPIGFGDMTPRSQKLTEDHPFETRNAKSDNVRGPLYTSKAPIPVKGYKKVTKKTPIVHPLILLLQPEVDKNKIALKQFGLLKFQTNEKIRLAKNNLTVKQYDRLLYSKNFLNQNFSNMQSEYFEANNYVNGAGVAHGQNAQSIQFLNFQRSNILRTLNRTDNVNNYESHQQNVNTQSLLYQQGNPSYDWNSHNNSYNESNRLGQQQDVTDYYDQLQQINTLNSQISNLENENSQIERNIEFYRNKAAGLNSKLYNANQDLARINFEISSLELDQDVISYNSLFLDLQYLDDLIGEANYEIISMQNQLRQIN